MPYKPFLEDLNIAPLNGFATPLSLAFLALQYLWIFLTSMLVLKIFRCSSSSLAAFSLRKLFRFCSRKYSSRRYLCRLHALWIARAALNLRSSSPLYSSCFYWISANLFLSSAELYFLRAILPLHAFCNFIAAMIVLNSWILLFKLQSIWFKRARSCM